MPASKAQQKAVTKYMKAKYDEIKVRVEKGQKDIVHDHAAARGESVNGFIGRAIVETMERDNGVNTSRIVENHPESAQWARVVSLSLPSETFTAAQKAADAAGETVTDYAARVIMEAVEREDAPTARAVLSQVTQDAAPPQVKAVPAPVSFDDSAISENVGYICAMLNRGENKAVSKGRSKVSQMAFAYLRDILESGYTMDEIRAAAKKAAQDGYSGSWYGFPAYCRSLYGKQ